LDRLWSGRQVIEPGQGSAREAARHANLVMRHDDHLRNNPGNGEFDGVP
jgi:hypothetical protein